MYYNSKRYVNITYDITTGAAAICSSRSPRSYAMQTWGSGVAHTKCLAAPIAQLAKGSALRCRRSEVRISDWAGFCADPILTRPPRAPRPGYGAAEENIHVCLKRQPARIRVQPLCLKTILQNSHSNTFCAYPTLTRAPCASAWFWSCTTPAVASPPRRNNYYMCYHDYYLYYHYYHYVHYHYY